MRRSAYHKTYVYIGFFLILLLASHFLGWTTEIEIFFRSLILKPVNGLNTVTKNIKNSFSFIKKNSVLVSNLEECRLNLQIEKIQSTDIQLLKKENDELKQQLSFKKKQIIPSVGAEIISKDNFSFQKIYILNRGELDGVKVGQPVVSGNGIIIGKIKSVTPNTSSVLLINDNQSKIAATIINHDASLGVVEGGFGISLRMSLIPRNELINIGDTVVTSGLEERVPRGLLIGTVTVIENEAYQPFQGAVITPSIDLTKFLIVSILLT